MRRNLGGEDRLFRLVLALSILPLGFVLNGQASLIGLIGLEPLLAALVGWSPFYAMFGIRSCVVEPAAALATPVRSVFPAA
jgi:hypothetical protein